MHKIAAQISIILLGTIILTASVNAQTQVSLTEALRAAQNTVEVMKAQDSVDGVSNDITSFVEGQRFNWQVQSPAFTSGSEGVDERGSWSLIGTSGGLDTVKATVHPDDLSVVWSRDLLPNPVTSQQLKQETLRYNLLSAETYLSERLSQTLLDTYQGYLSLQLSLVDLAISQKQAEQARGEYERLLALSKLGEATLKAVTRAKAELLRVEAQVKQKEVDTAQNTSLLMVSIGFPADATLEPVKLGELRARAVAVSEDNTLANYADKPIVAESTEISLLKEQVRLKELAVTESEADSLWSAGVSVGAGVNLGTQEPWWEVQAGAVTYDLSGGGRRQRAIDQAEQALAIARRQLAEAENRVSQEYHQAVNNLGYQRSLVQAAVWEWEAAQADYQVAQEQYRVGAVSDHDLAKAEMTLAQAEVAIAKAYLAYEVQKYTVLALQGEQPLLALVKGETANEG